MYLIQQITNAPLQTQTLILPSGESFLLEIYFRPQQLGWFITKLIYGTFELHEVRITVNPNMLYQWKNLIPFGLGCFSVENREPSLQDDFLSGAAQLYLLDEAEVIAYAGLLRRG